MPNHHQNIPQKTPPLKKYNNIEARNYHFRQKMIEGDKSQVPAIVASERQYVPEKVEGNYFTGN